MNSRTTTLILDIVAVFVFAVLARLAHQTPEMPFTFPNVVGTFWPFALGTLIAWAFIWSRATAATAFGRKISLGAIVWICTAVAGLAIWGIRHGAVPHWSFMIVATTMSAILILGWRGIASLVTKK